MTAGKLSPSPIRWMINRDLAQVLEIERLSSLRPMNEHDFRALLRQRNVVARVVEYGTSVAGYFVYAKQKSELEILLLAVHPGRRRQGIGTSMIQWLKDKFTMCDEVFGPKVAPAYLAVNERQLPAQLFLRKQGFTATRVEQSFEWTDALYHFEYLAQRRVHV